MRLIQMPLWSLLLAWTLPVLADPASPPDPVSDQAMDEAVSRASAASDKKRRQDLETGLEKARIEADDASRFWPILTIGLGLAALAGGVGVGAHEALSCSDSCSTSGWIGPLVMGGGVTITGGLIWLHWANASATEVENKRDRFERELRHLQYSLAPRRAPTVLNLRF